MKTETIVTKPTREEHEREVLEAHAEYAVALAVKESAFNALVLADERFERALGRLRYLARRQGA